MYVPLKVVGLSTILVLIILIVPLSFVSVIVKYLAFGVFILAFIYLLSDKFLKKK